MKTPAKVLKSYYYDRGMGKYLVEEARLLKVQSYRSADTEWVVQQLNSYISGVSRSKSGGMC